MDSGSASPRSSKNRIQMVDAVGTSYELFEVIVLALCHSPVANRLFV